MLTVGKHVIGGVLERLEGLVLLEALGQMLGGLRVQSVEAEAANKGNIGVSAGADTLSWGMCGAHLRDTNVWFTLSISVIIEMPSVV